MFTRVVTAAARQPHVVLSKRRLSSVLSGNHYHRITSGNLHPISVRSYLNTADCRSNSKFYHSQNVGRSVPSISLQSFSSSTSDKPSISSATKSDKSEIGRSHFIQLSETLSTVSELYAMAHPSSVHKSLRSCFKLECKLLEIEGGQGVKNQRWRCTFTCPVTNQVFYSGILVQENGKGVQSSDGSVFYHKKRMAELACAARVLDSLANETFWECLLLKYPNRYKVDKKTNNSSNGYAQFCEENVEVEPFHIDQETVSSIKAQPNNTNQQKSKDEGDLTEFEFGGLGHRPQILQMMYKNAIPTNDIDSLDEYYNFTMDNFTEKSKIWWTCEFTCPITDQKFQSGTLFHSESAITVVQDGKIYYRKKKIAKYACASRALDCLTNDDFWISEKKRILSKIGGEGSKDMVLPRFCEEEPHGIPLTFEKQYVTKSEALPVTEKLDIVEELPVDTISVKTKESRVKSKSIISRNGDKIGAFQALQSFHRVYNPTIKQSEINSTCMDYDHTYHLTDDGGNSTIKTNSWTATFKSPITGEIFAAGEMLGPESSPSLIHEGKNYYSTKKKAQAAAFGRAVDCFLFRGGWLSPDSNGERKYQFPQDFLQEQSDLQRFCSEEPYESSSDIGEYLIEKYTPKPHKTSRGGFGQSQPKQLLNRRYQIILSEGLPSSVFTSEEIFETEIESDDENESKDREENDSTTSAKAKTGDDKKSERASGNVSYWTASFECPVTGNIFPSGTQITYQHSETDSTGTTATKHIPTDIRIIDGKICYLNRKDAEDAAAAWACDYMTAHNFWQMYGIKPDLEPSIFSVEGEELFEQIRRENEDNEEDYVIEHIPSVGDGLYSNSQSGGPTSSGNRKKGDTVTATALDVVLSLSSKRYKPRQFRAGGGRKPSKSTQAGTRDSGSSSSSSSSSSSNGSARSASATRRRAKTKRRRKGTSSSSSSSSFTRRGDKTTVKLTKIEN